MDASLNGPFGSIALSADGLTIGRVPDNKLVLTDAKASSHHAEIRPSENGYIITDLGSTNGTFVNEQQLAAREPRQLNASDTIRIGDTRMTYQASSQQIDPTVYAEKGGSSPAYDPTVAAPPPAGTLYGSEQPNYQPPAPSYVPPVPSYVPPAPSYAPPAPVYGQPPAAPPYGYPPAVAPKRSNRTLFIILGSVLGGILLLCVLVSVIYSATRSTPEKTLTTYCTSLKSGDYQTAYNQFSSSIRSQETEGQFASAFTITHVTNCSVSNTGDDGTLGRGVMSFTTNVNVSGINDYQLIQENGEWKINSQIPRK